MIPFSQIFREKAKEWVMRNLKKEKDINKNRKK